MHRFSLFFSTNNTARSFFPRELTETEVKRHTLTLTDTVQCKTKFGITCLIINEIKSMFL